MQTRSRLITFLAVIALAACEANAPGDLEEDTSTRSDAAYSGGPTTPGEIGDWDSGTPGSSPGSGTGDVEPGQLTAAEFDDNLNPGTFEPFIDDFLQDSPHIPAYGIHERIEVRVENVHGHGISNALVQVMGDSGTHFTGPAGSDGRLLLFPGRDGFADETGLRVAVSAPDDQPEVTPLVFDAPAGDEWTLVLPDAPGYTPSGLDLAFVVDATGSMGDEMRYVVAEVQSIVEMIQDVQSGVDMRYALIVYRDEGDAYVTRTFDFTSDLEAFAADLADQSAGGGGDYPEAVDQALGEMNGLAWRDGNVARVAFFIADAPPHDLLVGATFDELDVARTLGIRIYPVAASGVANLAEYVMRSLAQATHASYLFITDDSGIGGEHAEPHIPCYHVELLNNLMVRMVLTELAGARVEPVETDIIRTVGLPEAGVCLPED